MIQGQNAARQNSVEEAQIEMDKGDFQLLIDRIRRVYLCVDRTIQF